MSVNGLLPLLAARLAQQEDQDSVARHWFYEQVRRARASENAELAELMLACAIPASFDIRLVGILREQPNDNTFNGWLFDALSLLSKPAIGGGQSYLPAVRDQVLADFADPPRAALFKHYRQLLFDYYVSEVQRLYRRGQFEVAYYVTDQALALPRITYPPDLDTVDPAALQDPYSSIYLWRGRILDAIHRTQDAIREYDQAIRSAPEFGDPYFHRGMDYESLGDHAMALDDLSQSIVLQPEDGYNYWGRGYIYFQTEQFDPALQDFDLAVHFQPGLARNYHWRACAYRALRDFSAALADHNRAIEMEPYNASFVNHRGITYDTLGDHRAALNDYSEAITLEPRDAAFFYNRATANYTLGDLDAALTDYQQAAQRDPHNATIFVQRGLIYDQLGHYQEALADYARAITLEPLMANAYTFRALISFPIDSANALIDAERATALESTEIMHFFWYAAIAFACDLPDKAAEAIMHALLIRSGDSMAHYWAGLLAMMQFDHDTMFAELDWAIALRDDADNRAYAMLWRWLVATLSHPTLKPSADQPDRAVQLLYARLQAALMAVSNPIQRRKLGTLIALGQGQLTEARAIVAAEPPIGLSNMSLLYSYLCLIAQRWPEHAELEATRAWVETHLRSRYTQPRTDTPPRPRGTVASAPSPSSASEDNALTS